MILKCIFSKLHSFSEEAPPEAAAVTRSPIYRLETEAGQGLNEADAIFHDANKSFLNAL